MYNFYCYVYYNEQWEPYYVGKGIKNRRRATRKLTVPPNERIQLFYFEHEWQAFECEIQLISFWKRQCDGGPLQNISLGGPGCPGVIPSEVTRSKRSQSLTGRIFTPEWKEKISQACKGRTIPETTRLAASKAHKDKPKSAEHRAKISAALKGNKNGAKTK